MIEIILFILGLSLGSFINVLSIRYNPNKSIISPDIIHGRSKCPYCQKTLKWYELIPVLSFILQGGKCRSCKHKLSLQYPIIEILSGLITLFTFIYFKNNFFTLFLKPSTIFNLAAITVIWILILLTLLLITLIDLKMKIIPDETLVFILILGIVFNIFLYSHWNNITSFIGNYSALFGFRNNFWINKLIALAFVLIFFGGLVFITHGKGMGMGDVKLMAVLSIIFGWPDILIIGLLSPILGAIISVIILISKRGNLKSAIPFAPFITIASYLTIFLGEKILSPIFNLTAKLFNV